MSQPTAPEAPASTPVPGAASLPVDLTANPSGLDAAMQAAYAAAMAEADQMAQDATEGDASAAPPEAPAAPASPADGTPAAAPAPDAETPRPASTPSVAPDDTGTAPEGIPPTPPEQQPSRREAARLQQQLLAAETEKQRLAAELDQRRQADATVVQKWQQAVGDDAEMQRLNAIIADERTPFQQLEQARSRLRQMQAARAEIAPILQEAQARVAQAFVQGFEDLRGLDGMDEARYQSVLGSKTGTEALRAMHGIGVDAGKALVQPDLDAAQQEIASLKAQVSDLKTKVAAAGQQPAAGAGITPADLGSLAGMIKDGKLTDEAIERAMRGELIGLDLSAPTV